MSAIISDPRNCPGIETKTEQFQTHVEYRKFGPPGTGKTTSLARDVGHAAEKFGTHAVMVASYSKAAAEEIVSKNLPIPPDRVGTLHAMGYRAIGKPRVVDAKALVDWNEHAPSMPINGETARSTDDPLSERGEGLSRGDELLAEYELLRARMQSRDLWPASVKAFANRWGQWKRENDLVDFGDMIELAWRGCPVAPGNPTVGFFDECQDSSALEWALIRRWARVMEYVVCVGDDDQAIYEWRGASADAFLNPPLPDSQVRVLSQSYRVPAAVHSLATKWIGQVRGRQPKPYRPRTEDDGVTVAMGKVTRLDLRLREREELVETVARFAESGRTVAILASCSYMLGPVVGELRRQGVPFHNPWRKSRGDWNPLTPGRGTSTADRLLAWLGPSRRADGSAWTLEELRSWSEITSGMLARGAKTEIGRTETLEYLDLVRWLPSETLAAGAAGDLGYLLKHVTAAKAKAAEFPARVIAKRGPDALTSKPRVIVSTIHGSKGGQADVVVLAPDLSRAGAEEWSRFSPSILRLFYVAMTRAREELVILEPNSGRMAVEL